MECNDEIRIFAQRGKESARIVQDRVEVCYGDLNDRASLEAAVDGVDRVLHCAARTGPWGPKTEYQIANVHGLKTLVDAAMAAGVQRIVHVSSVTVHGVDVRGTADETTPLRGGLDPYSRSKVAGEQLLQQLIRDKGAPVTIVRPGLVYGPRDTGSFGRFAALIEHGKMVVIGPGNNQIPLVYVTDVVKGILLASATERAIGREYVLVNDEPVTQSDYLNAIASELRAPLPSRHIPYRLLLKIGTTAEAIGRLLKWKPPLTRFGVELLGGENRFKIHRARLELGFVPRINLAEGVSKGIAWYRATPHSASS